MTKESILLGIAGIVLGVGIVIKTQHYLPALIPTIIGIALIIFYKEEDKLEKRRDKKQKTK
ncbi:hypothetical protein J4226_04990 [Candidatus Pacearchaeota archaeon]|nr:hypothetical protein [Candidatus Pacearchaeota archaeon]